MNFDEIKERAYDYCHAYDPAMLMHPELFEVFVDFLVAFVCYVEEEQRQLNEACSAMSAEVAFTLAMQRMRAIETDRRWDPPR